MGTPGPYFTRENRDGVPILMGSPKFYDTGVIKFWASRRYGYPRPQLNLSSFGDGGPHIYGKYGDPSKVLGTPRHDVDSTLAADVQGIDMVFDTNTVAAAGVTGFFREK